MFLSSRSIGNIRRERGILRHMLRYFRERVIRVLLRNHSSPNFASRRVGLPVLGQGN